VALGAPGTGISAQRRGYSQIVAAPASRIGVERLDRGVAVLIIEGEHDLEAAPDLRKELSALIAEDSALVVDLSSATFIDSSVVTLLVDAHHEAEQKGNGFAAALPSNTAEGVRRVIEVTGLAEALPIEATVAEAVASVRREGAGE
jgi:anti-sigma B factor antagonist